MESSDDAAGDGAIGVRAWGNVGNFGPFKGLGTGHRKGVGSIVNVVDSSAWLEYLVDSENLCNDSTLQWDPLDTRRAQDPASHLRLAIPLGTNEVKAERFSW
jgi:hypothetical protein